MDLSQLKTAALDLVAACDSVKTADDSLFHAAQAVNAELETLVAVRAAEQTADRERAAERADDPLTRTLDRLGIEMVMTPFGPGFLVGGPPQDGAAALVDTLRGFFGIPEPGDGDPVGDEPVRPLEPSPTFLDDGNGVALFVGDRVFVRESARFGEVQGTVTGADNGRVVMDIDISSSTVLRDSSHEELPEDFGKGYTSSPGRVTRIAGQTAAFAEA